MTESGRTNENFHFSLQINKELSVFDSKSSLRYDTKRLVFLEFKITSDVTIEQHGALLQSCIHMKREELKAKLAERQPERLTSSSSPRSFLLLFFFSLLFKKLIEPI